MTAPIELPGRALSPSMATPDWQPHLHGMRGLAASYVVGFHFWQMIHIEGNENLAAFPKALRYALDALSRGRLAVSVFIVLSGYLLMGPVVRKGGVLTGGAIRFYRRRAVRILPPYYVALAATIAVRLAVRRDLFSARDMLSHIFLVHNLSPDTIYIINVPMWSIATECQIYLLFPILLLPIWRRLGAWAAIAVGFAIGMLPWVVDRVQFENASPWYLGLFALGMGAATVQPEGRDRRWPWGWMAAALWLAVIVVGWGPWGPDVHVISPGAESLVGAATACLLVHLVHRGRGGLVDRILSSPATTALGTWSYSLYLTHGPVLRAASLFADGRKLSPTATFGVMLGGVAVSYAFGYAFFRAVERPLLPRRVALHTA